MKDAEGTKKTKQQNHIHLSELGKDKFGNGFYE